MFPQSMDISLIEERYEESIKHIYELNSVVRMSLIEMQFIKKVSQPFEILHMKGSMVKQILTKIIPTRESLPKSGTSKRASGYGRTDGLERNQYADCCNGECSDLLTLAGKLDPKINSLSLYPIEMT